MLGAGPHLLVTVTRLTIGSACPNPGAYPVVLPAWITSPCWDPRMAIPTATKVNPLQTTWLERGTVSGRVALLLRSAEIQPLFGRFVRMDFSIHPSARAALGCLLVLRHPSWHCIHPLAACKSPLYKTLLNVGLLVTSTFLGPQEVTSNPPWKRPLHSPFGCLQEPFIQNLTECRPASHKYFPRPPD